jgi:nucleoside-diphosphate-sugar epimerase
MDKRKRTALVTGACGFVGSHLVDLLVQAGYYVKATDLENVNTRRIDKYIQSKQIEYQPSDVRKKETLKPLVENMETVFHPAALFNLCISYSKLYDVNVLGTENLCKEATSAGVKRLINWSSSSIYGCWEGQPTAKTEKDPLRVEDMANDYAVSKYEQEKMAQSYDKTMRVTSVRPGNIYGIGTYMGLAMPMKNLKLGLLQRPPAKKGLEAYSSHVHVEDVARATEFLANKKESEGQVYNLVEDDAVQVKELFELACKMLNKKMKKGYENPATLKMSAYAFSAIAGLRNFFAVTLLRDDYKWYPLFDAESVDLMVKHHILSNKKIRDLGFGFKHSIKKSIEEVIRYHESTKWKEIPWFTRYKVK